MSEDKACYATSTDETKVIKSLTDRVEELERRVGLIEKTHLRDVVDSSVQGISVCGSAHNEE